MMVNLAPGANRNAVRQILQETSAAALNLASPGHVSTGEWVTRYVEFVTTTGNVLRNQITPADIHRLLWTNRYQVLVTKTGLLATDEQHPGINGLLSAELQDLRDAFDVAHKELNDKIMSWRATYAYVALDSSAYINGPKLEEFQFAKILDRIPDKQFRLLVPMAVVDELDNLKQHSKQHHRWRASYTTAVLARVLSGDPTWPGQLHDDDPRVTVELLLDPPGHTRLPITDDEIVDRLVHAQALAGEPITLITYDTGQDLRARAAGLKSHRLRNAVEDEDEPEQQDRRKARA
ncbi:hypothetical protein Lesp02_30560 [Lentzea sp. NBRC 105346]|uniref:PIN domain-containing protein n=1 Tax=Lentzea sp. NBRC 105346 TaxID=3032205 RepID=UPI0024A54A4C|nr:PIN domain-containing protein [Lentzea sp. NBRC 105346]GLZ30867.1 hypothetical protein Lesp02_30560 [Lentzea sp. NBRC 105346]